MIPVVRVVRSPAEGPYHGHMRVVSLLPSATEVLCAIGAEDLLVGRSHECDHPASVADRPILTAARITSGTSAEIDREVKESLGSCDATSLYRLDTEALRALEPDVILTHDLCEVCSIDLETVRGVAAGMPRPPKIVSLDPDTVWDSSTTCWRWGGPSDGRSRRKPRWSRRERRTGRPSIS